MTNFHFSDFQKKSTATPIKATAKALSTFHTHGDTSQRPEPFHVPSSSQVTSESPANLKPVLHTR
jgi:hypothetical protein